MEDTVKSGANDTILGSVAFGTAQNDTVNDDQGDEQTQALGQSRDKCLQQQVDHGNETSDDDDVAGDTDLAGDDLTQSGDNHVGAGQNDDNCCTHADAVEHGGGDSQQGAHTQQLDQSGVLGNEAFNKLFL